MPPRKKRESVIPVKDKKTGRFVPCAGNFLPEPSHGMPVFMELLRTRHTGGDLYARCGICGHNGFWPHDTVKTAFSRDAARASVPARAGMLPPVDGAGRPL